MLPQKIWLPENVSGAFWQQFLGWFSSNFYSCILSQRPPPNLSTSLKLVAIFISSNFTATLANFGLYLWSSTNNLYLYSLTEDDKEERAEDEGADDEGAGDERPSTWRRGSWQQSRRFTWCSCDTMNYIIKTFDALGPWNIWHPSSASHLELSPSYLSWWKYPWKWLAGPWQSQIESRELPPCYLF